MRIYIALIFTALGLFLLPACQEDPVLEDLENGVPVVTEKHHASIFMVQLNDFPPSDPFGASWDTINTDTSSIGYDLNGDADIFFNFSGPPPDPPIFWSQPSHYSNVGEMDTIAYFLLTQYKVEPFNSDIDINVYDYEPIGTTLPAAPDSTLIGTVRFHIGPFDPPNLYPTYVTAVENGISMTIGITWEE